jgi:hypothetical protein
MDWQTFVRGSIKKKGAREGKREEREKEERKRKRGKGEG